MAKRESCLPIVIFHRDSLTVIMHTKAIKIDCRTEKVNEFKREVLSWQADAEVKAKRHAA